MGSEWSVMRLEEVCEVTSSKRIYAKELVEHGVPFYKSKEIIAKVLGAPVTNPLFISEERYRQVVSAGGGIKVGDVLLTSRGTLGVPYVVQEGDRFHFADGNLTWFRNFKGLDSLYLKYFFLSPTGRAELSKCVIGSSQPAYTIAALKKAVISVPDHNAQSRIVRVLATYDELIANAQRRIGLLEQMARALHRSWFVKFQFPGHENIRLRPTSIGDVPEQWRVEPLESLIAAHIGGGWGKDSPEEGHIRPAYVIRGTDIPNARSAQVEDVPYRYHTESNVAGRILKEGDIVFEVSGGSKGQPVGRALLVTSPLLAAFDDALICASFCKRIHPRSDIPVSEMMYLSFLEGYESGEIEKYQVQSTGISNFKWSDYLTNTLRVVPPTPVAEDFRKRVRPLFTLIGTLGLQITNLRRTRDLLLPRLLSGQIQLKA